MAIETRAARQIDHQLLLSALSRPQPIEPSRRAQTALFAAIVNRCGSLIDLSAPLSIGVKVSTRCNLLCRHCWAYPATYTSEASLSNLLAFLENARDAGVLRIVLTGGEPLLRADITKIVSHIKDLGFFLEIFTNATTAVIPAYIQVTRYLLPTTDMIQLSLDGPTSNIHAAQRVGAHPDDFHTIRRAISIAKSSRITTRVNMTATPQNVSEISNTYQVASDMGATCFRVNPVVPIGRAATMKGAIDSSYDDMYLAQVSNCVRSRSESDTEFDFSVPWAFFPNAYSHAVDDPFFPLTAHCFSGAASWEVLPNGDTYPSAATIYEDRLKLGNVFDHSISSLWDTAIVKSFRRGRDLRSTKCSRCRLFDLCQGGKEEAAYLAFGSLDHPDPACPINP